VRTGDRASRLRQWQEEFPYRWDLDDAVSRRQLLRWAVMASGALFAATGVLAGLGYAKDRRRGEEQEIIQAAEVPTGGVHYFSYPTDDDPAILLNLESDGFVAYSGRCTHLSCAVYFEASRGRLRCPCHEGIFDPRTGEVIAGPPTRPLPRIRLREENGTLIAIEEVPG
jgi:nitrite reductase/ring-hydroxylating ferredoxin subunit